MIQQRGMTTRYSAGRRSAGPVAVAVVVLFSLGFSVGCASVTPSVLDVTDRQSRNPERPAMSADYDVLVGEMAARDGQFDEARAAFDRAVQKDPESGYLRFRLARLEAQTDDLVAALFHAERGLEIEPSSVDGRLLLGRLYRIDRNPAAVERVLRDETGDPVSPMAALMLYQVYLESGRMEEALEVVNGLLAEAPDDLAAYMAAATVYERMKDYAQAEAVLRKALDHHPNRFIIYSRLARLRRAAGDRPGEIGIYQEVLAEYPDHYGTLVSLGEAQIAEKDIEGAIETYSRISALFPEDLQIIRRLASLEFGAGHYEAAANRLSTALKRHPEHFEFAYRLGQVQRGLGRNEEALVTLESIPRTHPLYIEARMQIAVVLETDGQLDAALVEVEALRELRPDRGLDFHAASLRARIGDYDGGVAILQELLDETPNDEDVLYQLGVLAGLVQRVEEALGYMHQVLEQNPNNAQALNYIGYTWAERGERLDEAERLIKQALEVSPRDGYIADSLGWVYYMQALPLMGGARHSEGLMLLDQALYQLGVAVELTGGDPVVSEHLGDVYLLLDRRDRALDYYREAVDLKPRIDEQPNLQDKLERLTRELGDDAATGKARDPQ